MDVEVDVGAHASLGWDFEVDVGARASLGSDFELGIFADSSRRWCPRATEKASGVRRP